MRPATIAWRTGLALALALMVGTESLPAHEAAGDDPFLAAALPGLDPTENRASAVLEAVAAAEGIPVPAPPACPTVPQALAQHAERLGVPVPAAPLLPPDVERAVACLLGALHSADQAHDATFDGLDVSALLGLASAVEGEHAPELADAVEGRGHDRLLVSAIQLAREAESASRLLVGIPCGVVPTIDLAPILLVDGMGDSVHTDNYALTLEICGDDLYDNHAGGVLVAVGAGIYDTEPKPGGIRVPVGSGGVGVGDDVQDADAVVTSSLVLDLEGDDQYGMKHPPTLQDAANQCTTEDIVHRVGTLGGGIMGVGMLMDVGGNNTFIGRTQTQGAGHILGVGVLVSGPGNDTYEAIRSAQGSGLLGGVGVLLDRGGDDEYVGVTPPGGVWNGDLAVCDKTSRYTQGSAFDRRAGPLLPSVGILLDRSGNDRYIGDHLAQGFGQGPGLGLLVEGGGDDHYTAASRAQGASQGRSKDFNPQAPWGGGLAMLFELRGDDAYDATAQAQGWSLGNDVTGPPVDAVGALQWAVDRNEALGVLADRGGTDQYSLSDRGDHITNIDGTIGLLADE